MATQPHSLRTSQYRRACEYDAFVPVPLADLRLALPGDVAGVISDSEKAVTALNHVAGAELMPLARLLLRTESIASSKVEGMQMDARTLARAEANQETGRRIGSDAIEILANIDAMQLAIDRASSLEGIRPQDLIDIHRLLLRHAQNSRIAGRLRTSQNWIGDNNYNPCGAHFVPPPPGEVERLLEDLCRFSNEEELPALVQAAIAHAQFETIHPFGDGNGRTGRALVQVILRRRGLAPTFVPPISVMLARDQERYIKGPTLFREDRIAEWLEIFAIAAGQAAELAVRYSRQVADLQAGWRQQLHEHSNPRSDSAAWAIINILPAHPIVTVPIAVAATKRGKSAVTIAVAQLSEAGVLQQLSVSARNRAWEANGLLDLIVRLKSGAE
ncbi:MAG: Fic family protein [bacterium]